VPFLTPCAGKKNNLENVFWRKHFFLIRGATIRQKVGRPALTKSLVENSAYF
jgi:hypothetical protein